jgi:hypothetical protein
VLFLENGYEHQTKVKTFRLSSGLLLGLERVAKRAKLSENMFVAQVLTRALLTEPLVPAFGKIVLGEQTFASILSTANPDSLEIDGITLGKESYSLVCALFESEDYKMTFVEFLVKLLSQEGRWFSIECIPEEFPEQLVLHHKYGERWSLFLKSYLMGAYEVLNAEVLKIEVKDNILKVWLPKQKAVSTSLWQ